MVHGIQALIFDLSLCLIVYCIISLLIFFSFGIFLKLKLSLMIKKLFIETLGTLYIQQLNFGDFGELH